MTSIITLCIVIVTFIAISVIISKAGYSRAWALIPFAPLVTWIATLVMAKIQLHTFVVFWELAPFYPHSISILLDVDKITILASWLFLLLFAFSSWPGRSVAATTEVPAAKSRGQRPVRGIANDGASTATASTPHPASRYPLPHGPGFGTIGFVAGPGAAMHEDSSSVATKPRGNQLATFCARCGDSVPGNRALAHNCPNAGHPASFCRYCGKSIPEGSTFCPACDAAS